jgi:hypothetical protein
MREREEENEEETEGSLKEQFEKEQQGIRKRGKIAIVQKYESKKRDEQDIIGKRR